jgi:hypothetical protein
MPFLAITMAVAPLLTCKQTSQHHYISSTAILEVEHDYVHVGHNSTGAL